MKFFASSLMAVGLAGAVSAAQVGGINKIDPTSEAVVSVVHQVEHQLSDQINSPYYQRVAQVIDASSQVVSGILYRFRMEVGETSCKKSDIEQGLLKVENCPIGQHRQICEVRVLSQPWLNNNEITYSKCTQVQVEEEETVDEDTSNPGSVRAIKEGSDEMHTLVDTMFQLTKPISQRIGGANYYVLNRVKDATVQVVSGLKYRVVFEVAETQCALTEGLNEDCKPDIHRKKECTATIWAQPWMNKSEILDISCRDI